MIIFERNWHRRKSAKLVSSLALVSVLSAGLGIFLAVTRYSPQFVTPTAHAYNIETIAADMVVTLPLPPPPDCGVEACVALTFDDGPDPATTPAIIDALSKEGAKATFFMIGKRVAGHEDILRLAWSRGNEIGNHSLAHPFFTKLSGPLIKEQLDKASQAISAAGVPAPYLFRPPYGAINRNVIDNVNQPVILWNVDPKDWHEIDPARIVSKVNEQAFPGAIIILHDSHPATASAAPQFIHDLKAKYRLVSVSELLKLSPATKGVFYGHPKPH